MGRNLKYKTKEERIEANRLYSKKWYQENKDKPITEKCSFKYEPCSKLRNSKGGTYCQYHAQVMAKANKYNITPKNVLELYKVQKCSICDKDLNIKKCIDHNHKTGVVRKVICHNCNIIIGLAKEETKTLEKIIFYIKEHE